jgi:ribokinase
MISVALGANDNLSEIDLDKCINIFQTSKIVGFQLENKLDVVLYGLKKAKEHGALTFLDPAPATLLTDDFYKNVDFIKPNEVEASILTGMKVKTVEDAKIAGKFFLEKGVGKVIITLGEQGTVLVDNQGSKHFKTLNVNEKDTTGAGDIFAGAFMKKYIETSILDEAINYANIAASLSVQSNGVIDSIPSNDEITNHI